MGPSGKARASSAGQSDPTGYVQSSRVGGIVAIFIWFKLIPHSSIEYNFKNLIYLLVTLLVTRHAKSSVPNNKEL